MYDAIKNFPSQLIYEPVIMHGPLSNTQNTIVLGMGGSALAATLFNIVDPLLPIIVHRNYGLPARLQPDSSRSGGEHSSRSSGPARIDQRTLIIASSYSGNTEEVIDGYQTAIEKQLPTIAISTGGKLLKIAKTKKLPYIELPNIGIPRLAIGYMFRAIAKALNEDAMLKATATYGAKLLPEQYEAEAEKMAQLIGAHIPIIYASEANAPLAYILKIAINETAKAPAFYNVIPEENHNEINGCGTNNAKNLIYLLLKDNNDDPRIIKRFKKLKEIYIEHGKQIHEIEIADTNQDKNPPPMPATFDVVPNIPVRLYHPGGEDCSFMRTPACRQAGREGNFDEAHANEIIEKIFSTILRAFWTAYHLALLNNQNPDTVPLVEEFKKKIR